MFGEYPILYMEINAISFVLIAIILHKTKGLSKMMAQRNFAMSIVAEMVFFASDTLFVLISNKVVRFGDFDNIAMLMCKEIYFFSTAVMCFFWFLYFELLRDTAFVKRKNSVQYASLLLWMLAALLLINIFTGILFYVEPDGSYHRGPLFILTYVFAYIYVFLACIRTLRDMMDKSYSGDRLALLKYVLFPFVPGVAGLVQFVYPRLPMACGVLALATLILYLSWIDQLISLDPLTGLNNRKQLDHFYDQWTKNHGENEIMNVLMIDANRFKLINDKYGHIQGDGALKNIAEALKLSCRKLPKRANIARYGGDEFAVLFESENHDDVVLLKETITHILEEINRKTSIPFELTVSIGAASTNGQASLKELIGQADEAMYAEKEVLHRK